MKKIITFIAIIITISIFNMHCSQLHAQSWQTLIDSCNKYWEKQDFETALKWSKSALPQAEKEFGKMDTNYILSLSFISDIFANLGFPDSTIYYSEINLNICRKLFKTDHPYLANSIINMAKYYKGRGNYKESEQLYLEALEMRRRIFKGDHPDLASSINGLAYIYNTIGNYKGAEPLFKEALEMRRRIFKGDHPDLANSINNMAAFYNGRGNYNETELLLKEALEMRRRIFKGDHPYLANSINNMALFYNSMGNYKESEPLLKEALEMRRRIYKNDHTDLANSISSMSEFYNDMGNYKEAEPLYKEALEMLRRIFKKDHTDLANSINNYGMFCKDRGEKKQAEALLKESLEMYRRIFKDDHQDLANSMSNMALMYNSKGDYKKAEPLFKESLEMYRRIFKSDHPYLANSIICMASFYKSIGNYKEAEPLYKESLEMYRRIFKFDHPSIANAISCLAVCYKDMGNYKDAEPLFNEALIITLNILNNYFPSLSEKEKGKFWNKHKSNFELFNTFVIERAKENPGLISKMFDNQLMTKAILYNSSNNIKKRIYNSTDSILKADYIEYISMKQSLVKFYSLTNTELEKKQINLDSFENIANKLEKRISLKSEDFKLDYEKKKVTWKSIQTLLKPNEAAIEVVRFRFHDKNNFTDTIYYAFLIVTDQTEDHPELILFKNGKELENEYYNSYRNHIENKTVDDSSFIRYWGNLNEKLKGIKKLYFSTDGIYNKLNPGTFLMPDGKYLQDIYDIQQVNSTKDIILGFYQNKQESNIYNSAVLIGNPNFSLAEDEMIKISKKIKGDKKDDNSLYGEFANARGFSLSKLPGTEKEINNIEKFLKSKKWDVSTYLRDDAVKTAVRAAKNPRVLHIATHGLFLEDVKSSGKEIFGFEESRYVDNPLLRSGLFFTGADNYLKSNSSKSSNEENGILTAYEAMNLDLDKTELVVLSACETGLGEIQNGEGVFGLRRAFQQAGARTVLMSLWKVNDEATQELMSSFYKNWVSGSTKREAFNKAQQEIKTKYPAPYYWGAFVMVGE